jgi:Stress responsive A/B Barrel Domain
MGMLMGKRNRVLGGFLVATAILLAALSGARALSAAAADAQLAHMVYFKLKDSSGLNRAKLVAACKAYLSGHEGTVSFAVGTLAGDLNREVNDRGFDVSLHIVFANKDAHDKYQEHPRHLKFIEENKDNWAKVRVFDSYLSSSPLPVSSSKGIDQ